MAASSSSAMAQDVVSAQAESLRARGFMTRNTFIDYPVQWLEGSRNPMRSKSVPPLPAAVLLTEDDDIDTRLESMSDRPRMEDDNYARVESMSDRPRMYHKQGSLVSKGSKASTTCPEPIHKFNQLAPHEAYIMRQAAMATEADFEGDQHDIDRGERSDVRSLSENSAASSFDEGTTGSRMSNSPSLCARFGDVHELARLVERECGFLRLNGYTMHRHTSDRARRKGILVTMRFYIRGLPWAKRSRWQQPLFRAVGAVLQSHNRIVRMQSGELHVFVSDNHVVRIDFAAARL